MANLVDETARWSDGRISSATSKIPTSVRMREDDAKDYNGTRLLSSRKSFRRFSTETLRNKTVYFLSRF